ncbi:hypothetical protein PoB_000856300 [Plakobranchus ocellatus]|uniref:Uncharacterized protein n=1 Tax=Plakobranchus ocellatus TaxID=259542 RepID=A0AAV3YIL6_9GAST|nr:hypothetical protein PoB_000856300 [Plakobranchus ocellatus]
MFFCVGVHLHSTPSPWVWAAGSSPAPSWSTIHAFMDPCNRVRHGRVTYGRVRVHYALWTISMDTSDIKFDEPRFRAKSSTVDIYSDKALQEIHLLIQRVTKFYSERFERHSFGDKRSSLSEYLIQEGIGQVGLLHPS